MQLTFFPLWCFKLSFTLNCRKQNSPYLNLFSQDDSYVYFITFWYTDLSNLKIDFCKYFSLLLKNTVTNTSVVKDFGLEMHLSVSLSHSRQRKAFCSGLSGTTSFCDFLLSPSGMLIFLTTVWSSLDPVLYSSELFLWLLLADI